MTEERGRGFERVEEEMREVENEGKQRRGWGKEIKKVNSGEDDSRRNKMKTEQGSREGEKEG